MLEAIRALGVPGAAGARIGDGLRFRRLLRLRHAAGGRRLRARVRRRAGVRRRASSRRCRRIDRLLRDQPRAPGHQRLGDLRRDRRAARVRDALLDDFPFSAFVSKTITLAPRAGNPPPRLWETAAGMINSIGLPNKGLAGYLEHDLPQLAELPVPLITNVMGSTGEELAELVGGLRRPRGDRGPRAERLVPQRRDRARHRGGPGRARARRGAGAARDRQAACHKADAEHGRRRRLRPGRGGRRRRRRLADQHAARAGARRPRRAVAGRPDGRTEWPGDPQRGARAGRGRRRDVSASRSWVWEACRPGRTRSICSAPARRWSRVGTESFRDPAAGTQNRPRTARKGRKLRESVRLNAGGALVVLKNARKRRGKHSTTLKKHEAQVEAQVNFGRFGLAPPSRACIFSRRAAGHEYAPQARRRRRSAR